MCCRIPLTAQVVRMIMEPFRSNEMLLNAFAEAGFSPNSKVVHQILKVVHHLFSLGILGSPLRNGFKEPKYDLRFGGHPIHSLTIWLDCKGDRGYWGSHILSLRQNAFLVLSTNGSIKWTHKQGVRCWFWSIIWGDVLSNFVFTVTLFHRSHVLNWNCLVPWRPYQCIVFIGMIAFQKIHHFPLHPDLSNILHPPSYCRRVLPFKGKEMHERFAWEAAGYAGEHAALMVNATEQKSWPWKGGRRIGQVLPIWKVAPIPSLHHKLLGKCEAFCGAYKLVSGYIYIHITCESVYLCLFVMWILLAAFFFVLPFLVTSLRG